MSPAGYASNCTWGDNMPSEGAVSLNVSAGETFDLCTARPESTLEYPFV